MDLGSTSPPPQDSRRFYMLPQTPMDAGYYVYGKLRGKPAKGAYQYAHPLMLSALLRVAFEWQTLDKRRIGIGDISLADGVVTPDHRTHRNGLEVDIRPMRKDGREESVRWWEEEYDKEGTLRLILLFRTFAPVLKVYFNGPDVPFVNKCPGHDDHFHVNLRD